MAAMELFYFLLISVGFASGDFLGDTPIENPDLFGGDILGIEDYEDRNAIVDKRQIWPGGVVPYEEDPGLKATVFRLTLEGAFDQYKRNTCIRFVKRTNEKDYIRLFPGEGCYSHVGRTGGQQPVSLGQGCGWMGTIVHELGHAIGFYHEQNRSDRDDWLTILWDNIKEGMADQFFKLKPSQNQLLTPFDYDSLMLYGSYTFSKDRKKLMTMVGRDNKFLQEVISKYRLSKSDIQRINMLYNCMADQFFKLKPSQNQLLTPFDYDSLMLYGSYTFSKDRKKLMTMVGRDNKFLQEVIFKYRLSKSDIQRINMLYNCKQ